MLVELKRFDLDQIQDMSSKFLLRQSPQIRKLILSWSAGDVDEGKDKFRKFLLPYMGDLPLDGEKLHELLQYAFAAAEIDPLEENLFRLDQMLDQKPIDGIAVAFVDPRSKDLYRKLYEFHNSLDIATNPYITIYAIIDNPQTLQTVVQTCGLGTKTGARMDMGPHHKASLSLALPQKPGVKILRMPWGDTDNNLNLDVKLVGTVFSNADKRPFLKLHAGEHSLASHTVARSIALETLLQQLAVPYIVDYPMRGENNEIPAYYLYDPKQKKMIALPDLRKLSWEQPENQKPLYD